MKPEMRVLLVSPVGECGGAEQVFLNLARRLPEHGITPILACMQPGPLMEQAREQGLPAFAFDPHRYRQPRKVWQGVRWLKKLAQDHAVDLLHSNHMGHLYSGFVRRMTGLPEVWHLHDYPYRTDTVERFTHMLPCDFALFTTRRVASGYPRLLDGPHAVVYPACVDGDALRATVTSPGVRERLNMPDGPLFLTVARLQAHKGHSYLLDAAAQALSVRPDAVFAIVGKAIGTEQEEYRAHLHARCVELGIGERVRFVGFADKEDLVALYREATALVHPATSEGFGLTLLEAMALDVPVIAAAADGPQEILDGQEAGLLVAMRDPAALAEAMLRVLASPALAASLREGGARRVGDFQVETMVRQTAEVYRRTVEGTRTVVRQVQPV